MRARQLLAGALALTASLAAGALARPPAARAAPLSIAVGRSTLTRPLPAGFLGLALEYSTVPQWVDAGGTGQDRFGDQLLVQLIENLGPSGRPVLRIGGQSTDRTWWPVRGAARPAGVTYDLGTEWTAAAGWLAARLDARLMLSVNLEADRTDVAATEAAKLRHRIGRRYVGWLEIGNEPDLYLMTPWYRRSGARRLQWWLHVGTPVFSRSADYGAADYIDETERFMRALPADIPLAGPDAAHASWLGPFSALASPHGRIGMLDAHSYGLLQCDRHPASPRYPSIAHMLALRASRNVLSGAAQYVTVAHRDHIPFRIDEMGSVSCDGRDGVSNTMAAALWVMDALFTAARGGVDGVNLHSFPRSLNGLFDISRSTGRWLAQVHPLYYGALMFARADPTGARLLDVAGGDQQQVRTWATVGADHRVRVLLINVGARRAVRLRPPPGFGAHPATIERLRAPSVRSRSGVTLGGRSFGTTATGVLAPPLAQTARARPGGYDIALPAGSATLVTLPPRARSSARSETASRTSPRAPA